jgi:transcriptional regulator with XRE-family HTH domain
MRQQKELEERNFIVAMGARICKLRRECGLRPIELARSIGVSRALLYSYEIGETNCPAYRLQQIAERLEVDVRVLIPILSSNSLQILRGTQKRLRLSAERKTSGPDIGNSL